MICPARTPASAASVVPPVVFFNATSRVSGAELVLLRLVDLALDRGDDVVLACPAGPLVARLPAAVRWVEVPAVELGGGPLPVGALRLGLRALRAALALARHAPDGVLVVNSLLALPVVRLLPADRQVVWLVHDTVHRSAQRSVVRLAASRLQRVVAVSDSAAVPLRELGLEVQVAPHGTPWPAEPARRQRPEGAAPVVGCLALLTHWKGHLVLLDAVAQLPGVRLELAGGSFPTDAPHVAALRRRADGPDLAGRVAFLGHVDPEQAMRGWDVAVSASTWPEAGPLAVLEAMALGLPVVGTDHGGTSDKLADGAGLLVPPGDVDALAEALLCVVEDPELASALGAAARQRVAERYDGDAALRSQLDALVGGPAGLPASRRLRPRTAEAER